MIMMMYLSEEILVEHKFLHRNQVLLKNDYQLFIVIPNTRKIDYLTRSGSFFIPEIVAKVCRGTESPMVELLASWLNNGEILPEND